MYLDQVQLKNFLLDSGLVGKNDLEAIFAQAAQEQKPFEELLLNSGKVSEDDLRRAKAYVLGIPFVDLKRLKIEREILSLIPEPIARKHNIVAFSRTPKGVEVAMLDPGDLEAVDFIRKSLNVKIMPRLTDLASIKSALLQYQKSLKAEFGDIVKEEAAKLQTIGEGGEAASAEDLKKLAEDLPVVRIVDSLLNHAIAQKASDVHIEVFEQEIVVRYRLDGLLHDAMIMPRNAGPGIVARIKVLAALRLDEKRLPQDGRFKIEMNGQKVSFRVSILPTYYGEKVVMRLLPENSRGLSLEESGFHGEALERVHQAMRRTTGMLLVTGPTGSGKTTTLYTIMEIINTPDVNISTVEDPIEYQMARINQTQVKPEIGLTFANGLRALVRQDPDIIMVGEIRDNETASLAINAALTGHVVLSTLHTNSAAGTIPRLLDMGAEPFLLVSTINAIIAQRLVRRLAEGREKYQLTAAELQKLGTMVNLDRVLQLLKAEKTIPETAGWPDVWFYKPKAAASGDNDGYHGRLSINEVMSVSAAIKDLVMQGATDAKIEEQAKKEGMCTMLEDGVCKAAQGLTTIEEVLRVVSE